MWEAAEKVWGFFTPPDFEILDVVEIDDVERLQKANRIARDLYFWRVKVSLTLLIGALIMVWAISPWGVVFANGIEDKVQAGVKPVKDEVAAVKEQLSSMKGQSDNTLAAVNELLSQKVAEDLCRVYRRMKSEQNLYERAALRSEMDAHQRRYKSLTGDTYPEDRCK